MGRICPILNHPLKNGVLVDDQHIVNFIQKKNLDFLPNELVCSSCLQEITKLYQIKRKRALYKSRMYDRSISSLEKRGTSNTLKNSNHSLLINESQGVMTSKENMSPRKSQPIGTWPTTTATSRNLRRKASDAVDIRGLSGEPTTSKAAVNANKHLIIDSESDDESLNLNAVNGTRMPRIQPILPKRKPGADHENNSARSVMDEYIKTITGG